MEDSYIVIEEDNERKILREDPATREAYRELEQRYRHLTDPRPVQADWEKLRQQFLQNRTAPSDGDDADTDVPEAMPSVPKEVASDAGPAALGEASPKTASATQEETTPEKPIEEQVRELIETYKSQRPQPAAMEDPIPTILAEEPAETPQAESHGIRYTVMNESDVEILEGPEADKFHSIGPVFVTPLEQAPEDNSPESLDRSEKNSTSRSKTWRRNLPGIAAAAAVAALGLAWIYTIWN